MGCLWAADAYRDVIHWLASYPKSGNTWARMLLTAYHYDGVIPSINDTPSTGDSAEVFYQAASIRPLSQLSPAERVLIRNAALLNMVAMCRYRPVVVKSHHANCQMFGVRMIPPEMTASAVYVVRDPRKVAPSFASHFGKTLDEAIETMSAQDEMICPESVEQYLASWDLHVQSWAGKDTGATLIKYEDMEKDPADALERMLVTYNIKLDPVRIDRAVLAADISKLRAQEAEAGFNEASAKAGGNFFSAKKETLTTAQTLRIENNHCDTMSSMGY